MDQMDEKISLKAIETYSEAFAQKVAAAGFEGKSKINGQELLQLSEIKQINLFVIYELLKAWQLESQKLKSPYFNYEAQPVKEALKTFHNVLSNHISISKDDLLPLLHKAVTQTMFAVLDPYDFYSEILDRGGNGYVRVEDLKKLVKYLRINRPPLEQLVQRLEEKKLELVPGNEAFAMLDGILEEVSFTPEDIDGFIPQFSKVLPLTLEQLYEEKKEVEVRKEKVTEQNTRATLAENFQRITKIKDGLTINQKFMFTKILFKGDFESFSQAVDHLDRLSSHEAALRYLEKEHADWDKESEEYQEFMEMVANRFS